MLIVTHGESIGPELFGGDDIGYNEVFVQLEQDGIFL